MLKRPGRSGCRAPFLKTEHWRYGSAECVPAYPVAFVPPLLFQPRDRPEVPWAQHRTIHKEADADQAPETSARDGSGGAMAPVVGPTGNGPLNSG